MYKQKIGFSIGNDYALPIQDVLKIIKNVGFDAISPIWKTYDRLAEIVGIAEGLGLELQSLHAPFTKAAKLWSDDESIYGEAKKELFSVIDACVEFKIPIVVAHVWIGFDYKFDEGSLYYGNFDDAVRYAGDRNIKIAFENT